MTSQYFPMWSRHCMVWYLSLSGQKGLEQWFEIPGTWGMDRNPLGLESHISISSCIMMSALRHPGPFDWEIFNHDWNTMHEIRRFPWALYYFWGSQFKPEFISPLPSSPKKWIQPVVFSTRHGFITHCKAFAWTGQISTSFPENGFWYLWRFNHCQKRLLNRTSGDWWRVLEPRARAIVNVRGPDGLHSVADKLGRTANLITVWQFEQDVSDKG